jgi:hypothetical protein
VNKIFEIRVQKLFLITLILKIGSSFLGWYFNLSWSLGFTVPLLIMGTYVVLGYHRLDTSVTDDKFADTCYYLGFIFTVTSIIFCLFDLPNIGTRIQDIAVRFGAAMVSTVFGLCVRVYLVSFKADIADAIAAAEDSVLDATRRLAEQMTMALEKLQGFESQVHGAAKSSVERINMEVENLSKNHAGKLSEFFIDLANRNQDAFTHALGEVKNISQRLSDSVDGYSRGMQANLASIEAKVGIFTDAVTNRLRSTTFPDDYFAKHLDGPLLQLRESASALAGGVMTVSAEVSESSRVLSGAFDKLWEKAGAVDGTLDAVQKLAAQQQVVLDSAQGQVQTLGQLTATLARFDEALNGTLIGIKASNTLTSDLALRVSSVVEDGAVARMSLEKSLMTIVGKLDSNATASNAIAEKLDASTNASVTSAATLSEKLDASVLATKAAAATVAAGLTAHLEATATVTSQLGETADAVGLVASQLALAAEADVAAASTLAAIEMRAVASLEKVGEAAEQVQGMVRQLATLNSAVSQSDSLNLAIERTASLKVAGEPQLPLHLVEAPSTTLEPPVAPTAVTLEAAGRSSSDDPSTLDGNVDRPDGTTAMPAQKLDVTAS